MKNTTSSSIKLGASKIFILVIIAVLVIGGIFVWQKWGKKQTNKSLEIIPGQPPHYIQIKETPEGQIVKNTQKNISMVVPKGWEANPFIADKDLEIRKFGSGQILDTELQDGVVLSIYVKDNPNNLGIQEWIKSASERLGQQIKEEEDMGVHVEIIDTDVSEPIYENIGDKMIAKTVGRVFTGADFVTDAEEINILFAKNNLIFSFICTCVGSDYKNYCQECENIIKSKIQSDEF